MLTELHVQHQSADQLQSSYKIAPRTWRHSLHSICSRVASFPPPLTHYFIQKYTRRGDNVLDIFSGTGTAPLQACLDGRVGIGNDISPEAFLLTQAKVDSPSPLDFFGYVQSLSTRMGKVKTRNLDGEDLYFGSDFLKEKLNLKLYYHRDTLAQLLKLRLLLLDDMKSRQNAVLRNARFCTALVLGILHGDRPESLSLPLDRSKSLTSNHIKKMQKANPGKYERRYRDTIKSIALKAAKTFKHKPPSTKGLAFNQDAATASIGKPINFVITSPPYFSAHTYAYDNRHRLWFLGYDYRDVQKKMFQTSNQTLYAAYVLSCLKNVQGLLSDDSACVLVVGDVDMISRGEKVTIETGEQIAAQWMDSKNTEMEVVNVISDPIPLKSRRYIHVPTSQGIKLERIVVFHKGQPRTADVQIDWFSRPEILRNGPNWSGL